MENSICFLHLLFESFPKRQVLILCLTTLYSLPYIVLLEDFWFFFIYPFGWYSTYLIHPPEGYSIYPLLSSRRICHLSSIILLKDISFILIISFIFNYSHSKYLIYSSWGYLYLYVILVLSSDKCNWWTFTVGFSLSSLTK